MLSSSHIFVNHDPKLPLPTPSRPSTRFVCLSDTHSDTFLVPLGDVLLHSGDLTSWGQVSELKKTVDWLISLPHPVKILIAGNHDLCLDQSLAKVFGEKKLKAAQDLVRGPAARAAGIYYLEHESVEFTTSQGHRWKVYGSPAAPRYSEGAFQYQLGVEARAVYTSIPVDTDILLTHTPPFEVHDLTKRGKHAGCKYLANRLQQLELNTGSAPILTHVHEAPNAYDNQMAVQMGPWNCRLHVFGHIHEAYGASVKARPNGECVQVNAAIALSKKPIVIDLHVKQNKDGKQR